MENELKKNERESWGSRLGFIMASAGVAIGLGNIWRFPYLVGQNGGGAFIVAYLVILFFVAIPALMLEMGMGKLTGKGVIDAFITGTGNKKVGTAVGTYISLVPAMINMFYIIVIGYTLYYMYASIAGIWVNTDPAIVYQNFDSNKTIRLAMFVIVCLANSFVVYGGLTSGIEKACKIMIPSIFIIMGLVFVRSAFLPGFLDGLNFYMNPDWSQLLNKDVWLAAASQVLFSVGIGPGMMIAYGSHLKKDSDITLNAITVSLLDSSVALMAGFAIIPATIALGLSPQSGPPLIFIVLITFFKTIPFGRVWAVLFFIALFFAGFSSSISHLETPITSFMDKYNWSRKKAVIVFTIFTLIGGTLCVYNAELYNIVSTYAGDYFYGLSALMGVIVFGWKYKAKRIREESINPYSDIKVGKYYDILVKYVVTPILAFVVIGMFI